MADLGSVGTGYAPPPRRLLQMGEPWWWDPANRAIGKKNQDSKGGVPGISGFFQLAVPNVTITTIVASYGSPGGSIALF